MTGYTVHTGTSVKFSEGWDRIFSGAKKKPGKKAAKHSPSKAKGSKSRKKS